MKWLFGILLTMMSSMCAIAQQDMTSVNLSDLSAFRPQAGNWQVVGDVTMNPFIDIHQKETPVEETKKKKKSKKVSEEALPKAVEFKTGNGILLNMNDDTKRDALLTTWEHGDIELEFDVMLPKGSNSGVYLQGRYEVQLLDSWGIANSSFSDIGGIYRNWENEPGKIYMGKAPLSNACKAPGLWQHMKISFRAPKFDPSGKKIANARFVNVELNGVQIHSNVEVPLPTGGPIENNEKPTGPLMIQGDHGPVAFKNIRYKLMKEADFKLSDIFYETHYGSFKMVDDFAGKKPASSGKLEELTCEVVTQENEYGIKYLAKLTVPDDAEYELTAVYTGGTKLLIDNKVVIDLQRPDAWETTKGSISLKAGTYPVELYNFKNASWAPPRLALYIRSSNIYPEALHAFNSYPPSDEPTSPIYLDAGSNVRILRAFLDFEGDRKQRLTHTVGVGEPSGLNYVYDLASGNPVCLWRGDFVDATPMWHDRGDGSFKPMGAPQYLFKNAAFAVLSNQNESFTEKQSKVTTKGYVIDEKTGRPTFIYTVNDGEINDKLLPSNDNKQITREITLKAPVANLYHKLAEGSSITKVAEGLYAIGDKQYYIQLDSSAAPLIQEASGKKQLILPVTGTSIKYSLIW